MRKVLAVETSCDDTCVSVVREDGYVELSLSQNQDSVHKPFGGIVPEQASRNHSFHLLPLIEQALKKISIDDISVYAVTNRPGLLGSLLVGYTCLKTLALLHKKPLIGVNHIEGHILSPGLYDDQSELNSHQDEPYICLVVSGGHTHLFKVEGLTQYELLGQTLDDAAGEAFDKFSVLIGLSYPGGPQIDRMSQSGNPKKFSFPIALKKKGNLNFSFSGLKNSARLKIGSLSKKQIEENRHSLCASYQEAIVNQIIFKLNECAIQYPEYKNFSIVGGVSANTRLRLRCEEWAQKNNIQMRIPPLRYCTDNAAMIGYAGLRRFLQDSSRLHNDSCYAHHLDDDFIGLKS